MVSRNSPPHPSSGIRHQFLACENQFQDQNYYPYGSNTPYSEPVGALPSIQSLGERMSRSIGLYQGHDVTGGPEISHSRHLMDFLGGTNEANHQAQGLSLSLSSHLFGPSVQYRQSSLNADFISPNYPIPGEAREGRNLASEHPFANYPFGENVTVMASASRDRASNASYGTEGCLGTAGNSRYLRATQALLEEVVSICRDVGDNSNERYMGNSYGGRKRACRLASELKAEIFPAENPELQDRMAKLLNLLEEVEERHEKYFHYVEDIVSSFEAIAGVGAAKSYTALALQAMARHFSNLRGAIISQINITKRKMLQDIPKIRTGISQLGLFDQESRHKRMALQQLGMFQGQRQAWRPIRGLPETSVAILRAWLFEHFLHPYPNDSEKLMLASQTGLSKNQVSNWFINARVRLWKPMIEEMYKEEFAESSDDSNPPMRSSMTEDGTTGPGED